jgi:hypothetical protein
MPPPELHVTPNVRRLRCAAAALALLLVAGVTLQATPAAAQTGISVEGKRLLKDGKEWIPTGFTVVSFVAPTAALSGAYRKARDGFGAPLLAQAHTLGADVLRFQVSQAGLDERSSIHDPAYLAQITQAVREARAQGFAVILSMQWEPPSGLKGQPMMPSDITRRAWTHLAGAFAADPYVMLELFNEPGMWESTSGAWREWQSGMQSLVDLVRAGGANNVLLLDGLRGAHVLKGAPAITDPQQRLAYAIHPYVDDRDHGPDDWTRDFGDFARDHPVLTTEWNASSTLQCRAGLPAISRQFIAYLRERRIGLVLWALDMRGTLFDGQDQPMGFNGFECGKWGTGAAWISVQYFHELGK